MIAAVKRHWPVRREIARRIGLSAGRGWRLVPCMVRLLSATGLLAHRLLLLRRHINRSDTGRNKAATTSSPQTKTPIA